MVEDLKTFQKKAVKELLSAVTSAEQYHRTDGKPQVIAFRAPTGSGKTIVMAAVIETILLGNEDRLEKPDAIFVWLSDSPQLNAQSRRKIMLKADKIRLRQLVTITEDSFDQETLDDGTIYFLNTQKLGKSSRLVVHGDRRTWTIWQTLQNTAERKGGQLYIIIDEAHRGMRDQDAARATTIMQKFLKGSPEDGLDPMPIVIGMSATDERFRRLAGNLTSVRHDVEVKTADVRASGLLKDRIVITYPDQNTVDDMVILQAAADEWRNKCDHWNYYCEKQKEAQVRPVFVIQVENSSGNSATATEIGDCLSRIEKRTGAQFREHEIVHTFGNTSDIQAHGLTIHHVNAADIADNRTIRVVFFKENLSTGWDCPRAETMMSFRGAQDATYIAQLLGRMIRTPLHRHIDVDETLNEVRLFLPHFNRENVETVMKALQDEEGSDIPADVEEEPYGGGNRERWGYRPRPQPGPVPGQVEMDDWRKPPGQSTDPVFPNPVNPPDPPPVPDPPPAPPRNPGGASVRTPADDGAEQLEVPLMGEIDREAVAKFINDAALLTYHIRPFKMTDYLPSLVSLASLIKNTGLDPYALAAVRQDGANMIEAYIQKLKDSGEYGAMAEEVKKLNLAWQVFDAFGYAVDRDREYRYYTSSDEDIDRKFRAAEAKLGGFGLGNAYGKPIFDPLDPNRYMIDVILFAMDQDCVKGLHFYAKKKFDELCDAYRLVFARMTAERDRKQYDDIVSNGNEVSEHSFRLPEQISPLAEPNGEKYFNHFFVNEETGYARIKLDSWERAVIEEESRRPDFVCWLRNPSGAKWALCLRRYDGAAAKGFYPDFLIVRKVMGIGYVVDILEPHRGDLTDNLSKAKAFVDYAQRQPTAPIGRIQLIREGRDGVTGAKRLKRLDLAKSAVKAKVMSIQTTDELDAMFLNDSLVD